MRVAEIGINYIKIDSPKAETIQVIPKDDFEKVWDVWVDYKNQKLLRNELRDLTRYSKYIISILHWYENA